MQDFIIAALPWIAIGIAIALVVTNFRSNENTEKSKKHIKDDHISIGMCLGMCMGTAIGSALTGTFGEIALTYGICFGMLIGVIAGLFMRRK